MNSRLAGRTPPALARSTHRSACGGQQWGEPGRRRDTRHELWLVDLTLVDLPVRKQSPHGAQAAITNACHRILEPLQYSFPTCPCLLSPFPNWLVGDNVQCGFHHTRARRKRSDDDIQFWVPDLLHLARTFSGLRVAVAVSEENSSAHEVLNQVFLI